MTAANSRDIYSLQHNSSASMGAASVGWPCMHDGHRVCIGGGGRVCARACVCVCASELGRKRKTARRRRREAHDLKSPFFSRCFVLLFRCFFLGSLLRACGINKKSPDALRLGRRVHNKKATHTLCANCIRRFDPLTICRRELEISVVHNTYWGWPCLEYPTAATAAAAAATASAAAAARLRASSPRFTARLRVTHRLLFTYIF